MIEEFDNDYYLSVWNTWKGTDVHANPGPCQAIRRARTEENKDNTTLLSYYHHVLVKTFVFIMRV
jgi:hypothetical protein